MYGSGGDDASAVGRYAATKNGKDRDSKKKIVYDLLFLVENLSELICNLEKWSQGDKVKRIQKTTHIINKLVRGLQKCALGELEGLPDLALPQGLINHVSSGQSPNTWIANLMQAVLFQSASARSELQSLASLRNTLHAILKAGSINAVPAAPEAPTSLADMHLRWEGFAMIPSVHMERAKKDAMTHALQVEHKRKDKERSEQQQKMMKEAEERKKRENQMKSNYSYSAAANEQT